MKRQPQMNGIKSKDATDRGLISKGNQLWILIRRTDAEAEIPTLWPPDGKNWLIGKEPWCWERLRAGGEGDDRGWDSWMASLTRWTWIWASSGSWWWTGEAGVLWSMGSQRVRQDWATVLNWMIHSYVSFNTLFIVTLWRRYDIYYYYRRKRWSSSTQI